MFTRTLYPNEKFLFYNRFEIFKARWYIQNTNVKMFSYLFDIDNYKYIAFDRKIIF